MRALWSRVIHTRAHEQYVRSAFGRATQLSRARTRTYARRGRHCVTVTTLSFYVTSRASNARQKRHLLYMGEARIRVYTCVHARARTHVASKKAASRRFIPCVPGTLKSGFGLSPFSDRAERQPKTAPGYYDRSPSSDTRLSVDRP